MFFIIFFLLLYLVPKVGFSSNLQKADTSLILQDFKKITWCYIHLFQKFSAGKGASATKHVLTEKGF